MSLTIEILGSFPLKGDTLSLEGSLLWAIFETDYGDFIYLGETFGSSAFDYFTTSYCLAIDRALLLIEVVS